MFGKNKSKTAKNNSNGGVPTTPAAECKTIASQNNKSFFDEKWDIDENNYANLKGPGENNPEVKRFKLKTLIDERINGYVFEDYRDKNGHLRHRKHLTHSISGLIYKGEYFALRLDSTVEAKNNLGIFRNSADDELTFVGEIDMLDYLQFRGFKPVVDTRSLAFDIWRILNHEVRKND